MVEPSSFCCISTIGCANELVGLLCSLSIHNTNAIIYCMVDSKTANILNELSSQIYLDIRIINTLDKYSGKDRKQMEKEGIWSDFQMMKAEVIRCALTEQEDTFFSWKLNHLLYACILFYPPLHMSFFSIINLIHIFSILFLNIFQTSYDHP